MQRTSVLIIADDEAHRSTLEQHLAAVGCRVVTASSLKLGIERAVVHLPDVVLVSPELPDGDSGKVYRELQCRIDGGHLPLIVLAPQVCDVDSTDGVGNCNRRVVDLGQFAQGISTLACSANEMRLTASHVVSHGLHLDRDAYRATINGRELRLTLTEFNILWLLARNAGVVLTRQKLCGDCDDSAAQSCRSVDVHVKSLRTKLGDHAELIETVWGVGYRFQDSSPAVSHELAEASSAVT